MKTTSLKPKASRLIFSGLMLGLALSGCSKSEMVEKKQDQFLPDYQVTETADSYIIKQAAFGDAGFNSYVISKKQDPYPAGYWESKSQLKSGKIVRQENVSAGNSVISTCINSYYATPAGINNLQSKRTYNLSGVYLGGIDYTYNDSECKSIVKYNANSQVIETIILGYNNIGTHALEYVSIYDSNNKRTAHYNVVNKTATIINYVKQYNADGALYQTATYTYDKNNRVAKITFDGGGSASRVFTYDASGKLIKSAKGAYGNTVSVEYERLPEWNELFERRYTNGKLKDYTHYYFDNTTGNYDPSDPKNTINFLATQ